MDVNNYIEEQLFSAAALRTALATDHRTQISLIAQEVCSTILSGNKILLCGNGGSASDAQHIAAEFVGRFRRERVPLAAIALTANGANLTAIGNDFGFDHVFARQVYALGSAGDMLLALSTSGRSGNILEAVKAAKEMGITTVALTGSKGVEFAAACELSLMVPSTTTAHIQECHLAVCHILCEIVDEAVLSRYTAPAPVTFSSFSA